MSDIIISMSFDIINIIYLLVVLLISMMLHELGHGYTSHLLGDDTAKLLGRLTFNPLKHIDPFLSIILPISLALSGAPIFGGAKPVPYNPNNLKYGDLGIFLVAIAGPFVNFILALLSYGIIGIFSVPEGPFHTVLSMAVMINLGFMIFNLLPLPPLDGSRILYSVAPDFIRKFLEALERYSLFLLLGVLLLFNDQISSLMIYLTGQVLTLFKIVYNF
jgi:Zn-dependent protease